MCGFSLSLSAQMTLITPPPDDLGTGQYKTTKTKPEPRSAEKIKKSFPFDIPLEDTAKLVYNSEDLFKTNGKPLVVMFWLTTCGPCRQELETLNANFEAWQKQTDFRLLAISTDWEHNWGRFVERVKTEKWKFEAYHDVNNEFYNVLPGELNGLPQVFVFDKNGKIVYQHRRFIVGDEIELLAKIKEANL